MKNQKQLWEDFLKEQGLNYHYACLSTKEYKINLAKLGITAKSPESLKEKASDLPITIVKIGMDSNGETFNSCFLMGKNVSSEFQENENGISLMKDGFATPDEAYDFIIEQASYYNKQ